MERIATSKARRQFADVMKRAAQDGRRVKITHYGKTLAGLVSAQDLRTLEDCERQRADAPPVRKRAGGRR
jgi:prevent-host-death family protein